MNVYGENTYPLSKLRNMVLDKDWKPRALIIGEQTFNVSSWTELDKKFVDWLIKKQPLKDNKLPIFNHTKNEKYFINDIDQHKDPTKNGVWKPVGDFFVDTKYKADDHKKNIVQVKLLEPPLILKNKE